MEMAFLDVLRALARDRRPAAAVPQHHAAAAIFALGDHAFEVGIGHRMVLGAHRETLVGGVGARPLGHRPAFEHAVDFEADVVMEPRRSEEHTSELQSLMRISYAVFCLKKT